MTRAGAQQAALEAVVHVARRARRADATASSSRR